MQKQQPKKSNLKPQSLRKKICLKTWQIRGTLIGKFYEQEKLQITSHRFRACKNKKLKTIKQPTTLKPNLNINNKIK